MNQINLFRLGVAAAESGDMEQARALLLQVVEENPRHEEAWMWLCDIVDDPDDRIIALENVLIINPENEDARVLLETLKTALAATEEALHPGAQPRVFSAFSPEPPKRPASPWEESDSLLAKANSPTTPVKDRRVMQARAHSRLMAVHRAIGAGDRETALNILVQMVEEDENNAEAWLLLGSMAPTLEDQRVALENVLVLKPNDQAAAERLESLERMGDEYVLESLLWEKEDTLLAMVDGFLATPIGPALPDPSFLDGDERTPPPTPDAESDLFTPPAINPTVRLVEISMWPTLLFILLTAAQYFLDLPVPLPVLLLGVLSVFLGSTLAAAASTTPRHPLWIDYFGERGEKLEKAAGWIFGGLGWLLAVAPFVLFFYYTVRALMIYFTLTG